MKTIELTESNTTLRLEGNEATRSMDIKQVSVKKWPASGTGIKLTVLDEKDVPIYSQELNPAETKGYETIEVNKRFVFYDHLSLQVEAGGNPFSVVVHFE